MAKRRKKKTNPALPKWAVTVFAVIAVVLSIFTFGGDLIGIDTSFAQQAMDFIDRILYGGPTGPTPSLPVSGQVKVYIIDVGQGESILVTTDQSSLLIDAGEMTKATKCWNFRPAGSGKLDYVIATHPDADHIGGMDTVLQNIEVTDGVFFGYLPDKLIPTTKPTRTCWMSSSRKTWTCRCCAQGIRSTLAAVRCCRCWVRSPKRLTARTTARSSADWTLEKPPSSLTATRKRRWKSCCCKAEPTWTVI